MIKTDHQFIAIFPSTSRKGWWRVTKVFVKMSPTEVSWRILPTWSRTVRTLAQAAYFAEHVCECEQLEAHVAQNGWELQSTVRESIKDINPELYYSRWFRDV